MSSKTAFALAFALLLPATAGAAVLVDERASLVTTVGGGAGGADISTLQGSLGLTSFGFNCNNAFSFRLADDVTFATPVDIDTITVYAYQTGSTTTSTLTALFVQVFDRPPNAAGAVLLFGDTTTNRLASAPWSNIYRVTETTLTNTQRPIMAATTPDIGLALQAGTYWIAYTLTGSLGSLFCPVQSTLGSTSPPGVNALQFDGTNWVQLLDTTFQQGVPFTITGTAGGPLPDPLFLDGFE